MRDRVQGRLVSGSCTPQCLLGSNTLPAKTNTTQKHTLESSGNFFLPSFEYQITFDGSGSAATPRANQFSSSETAVHSRPRSHLSVHMLLYSFDHSVVVWGYSNSTSLCDIISSPSRIKQKTNKQRKTLHTVTNYSWHDMLSALQESLVTDSRAHSLQP